MSVFSQRYGYSEDQGIQYECVGKRLRNRLWNHFFPAEYDADPFNRDDDIYSTTTRFAFCLMVWKLVWEALPQGMSFSLNG